MNRRDFIEKGFFASLSTVFLGSCSSPENKQSQPKAPTAVGNTPIVIDPKVTPSEVTPKASTPVASKDVTYVKPDSIMAKNLKYVVNAEDADPALRIKRGKTEGKDQICSNCSFYTAEKGKDYGKCTLLPDGFVPAAAWCNTWAEKTATS